MADFTDLDFLKFLAAKSPGPFKCSFCGHGEFGVNVAVDTDTLNEALKTKAALPASVSILRDDVALLDDSIQKLPEDGRPAHAYYSIVCTNCGHAYLFHVNQVNQWREQQEKQSSDKDDG